MALAKRIAILGGGTISHVRAHLAIAAIARGTTARAIERLCREICPNMETDLILTSLADPRSSIETNEDVEQEIRLLCQDPATKVIFLSCALCDFDGQVDQVPSGKYAERLKSHYTYTSNVRLMPSKKIIRSIRNSGDYRRKDIFLVGFKTTCGANSGEQYLAGLRLLKDASCNLVLCNDISTRLNMVITPEEARYHETTNREEALRGLVEMTYLRSHLTFTQSTVVAGERVPWSSSEVPEALRTVVNYCIKQGAYKPFNGATVGHFAAKIDDQNFLTSIRKSDFNHIEKNGLVRIKTDGPDTVLAFGAKPSVGGQSQRIVFKDHPDCDCILHFHCPIRETSEVPVISQREYECGSHECGRNTSQGLKQFGRLWAVYLDNHGPNIVFPSTINPQEVIDFVEDNFDLSGKTGGLVNSTTEIVEKS